MGKMNAISRPTLGRPATLVNAYQGAILASAFRRARIFPGPGNNFVGFCRAVGRAAGDITVTPISISAMFL
jgi:hypothetical protein